MLLLPLPGVRGQKGTYLERLNAPTGTLHGVSEKKRCCQGSLQTLPWQQLPVCPTSLLALVILLPPALYCPEQPFSLSFKLFLYDVSVQIDANNIAYLICK